MQDSVDSCDVPELRAMASALEKSRKTIMRQRGQLASLSQAVSLKHDGTDGPVKLVNTDGTAIERADGTANTGANYQIITY